MIAIKIFEWTLQFLKKYWSHVLLVVGVAVGVFCYRSQSLDFSKQLSDMNSRYLQEIQEIDLAYEEEVRKLQENEKVLNERLTEIQGQHEVAEQNLAVEKKAAAAQIVKKFGDKPDELAEQMSSVTGFTVIQPKDEP